ncbi:MAG: hypothetical protein ACC726_07060 [Chloroflexota bacterium]
MYPSVDCRRGRGLATALSLALIATFITTLPAAAFAAGWTTPKRVFSYGGAPTHSMVTDSGGKTHIATQRGSEGIWYVTNASGPWTSCQLSSGNDREPSIVSAGGVVHIAFARRDAGQEGIFTASSNQPATTAGCGWALTRRFDGKARQPSMGEYGGTLSIAFRNGSKKLKFAKGPAASPVWNILETIDFKCCTSAPSLDLTTTGAARVAYGDGTSKAQGLKYAVRAGSGWKKSKARSGRVLYVSMVLDKSPGVFAPPSNAPKIVYVVRKKGTFLATKGSTFASGRWGNRFFGKYFGRPDVAHSSNVTRLVYGGRGNLWYVRMSGAIWLPLKLSGSGRDVKPQLHASIITFSRNAGNRGIYYTRQG